MSILRKDGKRMFPIIERKTPVLDVVRGSGEQGGIMERARNKLGSARGDKK